jgi:hypothetical protein
MSHEEDRSAHLLGVMVICLYGTLIGFGMGFLVGQVW